MKIIDKFFLLGVGVLFTLGLVSCNNEKEPNAKNHQDADTYVGVSLSFATPTTQRALPDDYNKKGEWKGRDKIENVAIFLVNKTRNTVDFQSFDTSSFTINDNKMTPKLAVKAHAGDEVDVYAVVNGVESVLKVLKGTGVSDFEAAFKKEVEAKVAVVAQYKSPTEESVMMTSTQKETISVLPKVSEEDAKNGNKNHAKVNVERVVARAMVTVVTKGEDWKIKQKVEGGLKPIAEITDITYAVGQSNLRFYIMKDLNYKTPEPVYSFNPNKGQFSDWKAWKIEAEKIFDNDGLNVFTEVQEAANEDVQTIQEKLKSETTSKFVLPVTHASGKENYKKGNTTFIEIRAKFKPLQDGWGSIDQSSSWHDGEDLFYGMNSGKFYTSVENAKNPDKGGISKQKVVKYIGATMKYVVWLNPNQIPNAEVSPTVRNQVYHIRINKFKELGLSRNPLDPNDPKNPGNPQDPNDPKNPDDPDDNPIDPNDPLTTDKTYLSVSVTVLPWTMHSYKIDLGNDHY